ncbi:MAG TPA: transketolase [Candidatus Limnocylindrales bacterium]|nr:transketolase [Candidatus Limnocylindrales bacterium]
MTDAHDDRDVWYELAQQLRVDSVRVSSAAGSGHPTSSLSAADLMAVLISKYLRMRVDDPRSPYNDHLIFSKGHASPLYYSILLAIGAIDEEEFLTYRRRGSRLEGHPTPILPWVDVATGSLGQGLPIGVGVALAAKQLEGLDSRVWVLCGDSEMAEGSMWEAFAQGSFDRLDNLVAVVDVNRLGQTGPTRYEWDLDVYARRLRAFGWYTIEIDGHDVNAIDIAYTEATEMRGQPVAIIARTVKGEGVSAVADKNGAHGKPVDDAEQAIAELGGPRDIRVTPPRPDTSVEPRVHAADGPLRLPRYELGEKVATRKAYGDALLAIGSARPEIVVLDGEVGNSTYTELFAKAHPERFFQMYIAEQQMIGAAVGMQVRGFRPHAATFAAFLSRAYDFVRMAAVSRANLYLCGSHAGVSIGEDGPSQMGLEDIAMMRAIHGSTVLYPCDANQTARLLALMDEQSGINYMRTTRQAMPVIYGPDEEFTIGGSRVLRFSEDDALTIVAAGITVGEALAAAETLAESGVAARVIDLYSVKPLDEATLIEAARSTGRVMTVEDHWPEGGIGEAVFEALATAGIGVAGSLLAPRKMPGSATPVEEIADAGIDAAAIVAAANDLMTRQRPEPVAAAANR